MDDCNREIFKDGSRSLKEFKKMKPMVAIAPCNTVRKGRLLLAGECYRRHCRVATESGKRYIRTLPKVLWQNEQNGECFADFNEENLYASRSGRARFYGVKRIRRDGAQAKRNYNAAHDIIAALFSTGDGKGIPEAIQHLLDLIKNYPAKGGLYHVHASLIPLSKMQPAYIRMYEQLTCKMGEEAQEKIYLKLPYIDEWRRKLDGNRLLEGIYNFREATYEEPKPEQPQHQLTFQEKLEQEKKRKREESSKMVKYLRHRTAHRMEGVKKEIALGQGDYEAEDIELATVVRYPLSLVLLQEELFDANQLQRLKMDELF